MSYIVVTSMIVSVALIAMLFSSVEATNIPAPETPSTEVINASGTATPSPKVLSASTEATPSPETETYLPLIAAEGNQQGGPTPEPGTPPLGVGLEGLSDWAQARMFVDAMKTARGFGNPERPWEGSVPTDTNGWPTQDFGVVVMTAAHHIGGTYRLSFDGKADVTALSSTANVQNLQRDTTTNRTTADVIVEDDAGQLMLSFQDTEDGARNIRLVRPGYEADTEGNPQQTFSQPFLDLLEPFAVLRFMDFTSTNNNPVAEWDERTTPNNSLQTRDAGGAWEYVIELANETGKDIWINVPHEASDNYIRQLAELLRAELNPDIVIYVEYSNEVWNWQFDQATYNLDQAQEDVESGNSALDDDGTDDENHLRWRRVAQRTAQISQIFGDVYSDTAINTQIRPVLAGQVGWDPSWESLKQQLDWLERNYGAPSDYLYGLAAAPYFNIPQEMREREDLTVDTILDALADDIEALREGTANYHALARYHNLKSLSYEGGQHLNGTESLETKLEAQFDPRMGELTTTYLTNWYADGGDLFTWFTLTSIYNQYGFWGLTDDVTNADTPKYQAALAMINAQRPAVTAGTPVPATLPAQTHLYVDEPDTTDPLTDLEDGEYVDYVVRAERADSYSLTLRVASPSDEGQLEVLVNSQSMGTVAIPDSGSPDTFVDTTPTQLQLETGLNVIRLRVEKAGFDIESLKITETQNASPKVLFIRGGPGTGGFLEGGSNDQLSDITNASTDAGNHGFAKLAATLEEQGFELEQQIEGPASDNTPIDLANMDLSQYSVIVLGSNNAEYPEAAVDAIENYVRAGGGLLVISDANWGRNWGDAPSSDQPFLDRFGLVMNQDRGTYTLERSTDDFVVEGNDRSNHPILANIDAFDGEGVSPITLADTPDSDDTRQVLAKAESTILVNDNEGQGSQRDATEQDGALVIVEAEKGRVVGHFDRNTFFNQNGAGTNINRLDNRQYAINLFNWLSGK
ncbi:MAG: carbohydrate-binding protein [Chloroflexota bacterium]